MRYAGVAVACVVLWLTGQPSASQAGSAAPLTGNPAIDEWIRTTFGQPVDPETLGDPVWGTKTLLSLTDSEREGARLFMQRCNVCHGAGMNAVVAYGPLLSKKNVLGREDDAKKIIRDGTPRMPAFRHALQPSQIDMIVEYLKRVEKYEPVY